MLTDQISTVEWGGLIFIILAEIGLFGGEIIICTLSSKTAGVMLSSGVYGILSIYSIVSVIISLLFMVVIKDNIKGLVIVQISVIAITAILLLITTSTSKSVGNSDKKTLESVMKMKDLADKVIILHNNTKHSTYEGQLEKISEAIKYCDNATTVATDDIVNEKIAELELALLSDWDNKDEKVMEIVDTILLHMKQRAVVVKKIKTGGF